MERQLGALLLAASCAPGSANLQTIWRGIKLTRKVLEFISECPEWFNYNRNLEKDLRDLRGKMESLQHVEEDVKTQLENSENHCGKKRKREVDHWLKSVKKKVEVASNVENDVNTVCYLPRFLFRAWLGSCITKEIRQLSELHEQGRFPEGLLLDVPLDGRVQFIINRLVGQVAAQNLDEIWAHLINPSTVKIGVLGREGIGKSALMHQVYNRLYEHCCIYYVNVPQNFTIFNLQAAVASEIKVNLPSCEGSEMRRAGMIFKALNSLKEFVLILDGLSQEFRLEDVGIPMEGNVQKLILTSRSLDVCKMMSCQETVVLETLSTEDSMNLFMEKLAPAAPLSDDIQAVAEEIVAKCDGMPSQVITLAVQLRGVSNLNEWKTTLNEM